MTTSQVSKAITRLEGHFGRRLFDRGSRGVALSEDGRRLVPTIETVLAQLEAARATHRGDTELMLGSPSYLQATLLPVVASAIPHARVRAFELPPALLRARAQDDGFDLLLLPGETTHLPPSWEATPVGELRKALFGTPALAKRLGKGAVRPEALEDVPFVCPIYRREGRVVPVEDDCPLPRARRHVGHQVATIMVALEVAAACDQLVFGPRVAAAHHLRSGALVEIPVAGWDVREPLSFACHVDRISAKARASLTRALGAAMRAS